MRCVHVRQLNSCLLSSEQRGSLKRWDLNLGSSTLRAALLLTFQADLGAARSKLSAAPGASREARRELTPWPSRWSSGCGRKSHRHPWHSPRTRVGDGSQDAPHTRIYTHRKIKKSTNSTESDTCAGSHTTLAAP